MNIMVRIGTPIAMASIAIVIGLFSATLPGPAPILAQNATPPSPYITAEIATGDDTVSWSDPSACSTDYNIYKAVTPPRHDGDPITSRTLIGTASSGSTEATLTITHDTPDKDQWFHDHVEIELYCGTYNPTSTTNALLSSTALNMLNHDELKVGTYSSSPLTALTISSGTLFPEFDRGKVVYTAEVANDVAVITLNPTVLTGYQTHYVKNPAEWVIFCHPHMKYCTYHYGDGKTTGIFLSDADADTDGFQINLDRGENRLALGVNKGTIADPGLYLLTVTVQNSPATGGLTITGSAQIGTTLTADTSDIADIDGLDNVSYSYQWIKNDGTTDTGIHSATGSTYTLVPADEGQTIKVRVSFTDDAGYEETLTSAATALVSTRRNSPPTGSPTISGTAQVGQTPPPNTSGISDADGLANVSYSYQWLSSRDTEISGATSSTYVVQASDAGKTIKVRVDFTDDAGNDETLTSAATASVAARPNSLATGAPTISGTVQVREPLTASTSGIADADGLTNVSHSYQWVANDGTSDSDIADATASTYTVTAGDVGKTIKVKVSFTDDAGNEESLTSSETAEVTATWKATLTVGGSESSEGTVSKGYSSFAGGLGGLAPDYFHIGEEQHSVTVLLYSQTTLSLGMSGNIGTGFVLHLGTNTFDLGDSSTRQGDTAYIYSWSDVDLDWSEADTVVVALVETETEEASGNAPATGAPTISGTAQVGETLTADTSGIADSDGLTNASYSYQWVRNDGSSDTDIQDATGTSYSLVDEDEGNTLEVKVSFTDDAGNNEALTSAATAAVAARPNSPAKGTPTISGTAQVGEMVTAITSGIADPDGLTNAAYSYQWTANDGSSDTDIQDAIGSTYTLVDADEGKTIKVKVSFTDDAGHEETLTSAATALVATRPNSPATGAPTIGGTVQVGETMTADTSGIADSDGLTSVSYSYQWIRNDGATEAVIQDATGASYTLADADEGKTIKVKVSFTDDAGHEETLTSAATAAVEPAATGPEEPTDRPHGLTATASENAITLTWQEPDNFYGPDYHILRHRPEEGEPKPLIYVDFTETDATTFTDTDVDPGVLYVYQVRATIDAFSSLGEPSNPIEVRMPEESGGDTPLESNSPATGAPTISGTAQVGETLTAGTSGIADTDGLTNVSYNYQWIRNDGSTDADIQDATGASYTLVDADQDQTIKVKVSFTDDAGNEETLTSAATAVVAPRPNSPATGSLTISGVLRVGQTLMVDLTAISDEDGMDTTLDISNGRVYWAILWSVNGEWRQWGFYPTYPVRPTDAGKAVTARWSFRDDRGTHESVVSAPTATIEATVPDPVQNLEVSTGDPDTLNLTWEAPTWDILSFIDDVALGDGGSPITGYKVQWKEADDSWEIAADVSEETVAGTSHTITGLTGGVEYTVRVIAINGVGEGSASSEENSIPTGPPTISGTAQVGETLTASTSDIADSDGLTSVSYSYQWIRNDGTSDSDISGATSSTYTLVDSDEGNTIKVRVSFIDDAGNDETLTSAATGEVAAAPSLLTVSLESSPASHNGTDVFTFQIRFSEEFKLSFQTLRDHAFTVDGGTVEKAKRQVKGSNIGWTITVEPDSNAAVRIALPSTLDCDALGAICTEDGRKLSNSLDFTVSGPS